MFRMRKQAERWGAELFQEDVEFIDVKKRPFTIQSSERKVVALDHKRFILSLGLYEFSALNCVIILFLNFR